MLEKYIIDAQFYYKSESYRYILGTVGKNPLIFIGLNPSTATPKSPDITCCHLTRLLNTFPTKFDSIILLNLYPFVATKSDNLPKEESSCLDKNMDFIKKVLKELNDKNKELNILLGWGSGVKKRKYFKKILIDLKGILKYYESISKFYYSKSENKNYPLHPIRYKKNSNPLNSKKRIFRYLLLF